MSISLDGVTSVPDPQTVEYDTGERTKLGKDAFQNCWLRRCKIKIH